MNGKSYVRDWLVGVREISGENVQSAYTSAARAWLRLSGSAEKVREMNESIPATPTERSKEVAIAQEILGTGEVFTVGSYTVLVWRPTPKTMAAYEPSVGTMVAEVDMHSERFARSALLTRGLIASR